MSGFDREGLMPFPNTYEDNEEVGKFSLLDDRSLLAKHRDYQTFLSRDDIMPRATMAANRVLSHLIFEENYRAGVYDYPLTPAAADELVITV